jgi:hypothetical protein
VRVHLAAEHALELELAHPGLEHIGVALDLARGRLVILVFGQLQQLRSITDGGAGAIELGQFGLELRALAPELLSALGDVPDGGVFQLAADFF